MAEKKCKYCAMMIPNDAKICPYCRKAQSWSIITKIGLLLVALVIAIPIIGRLILPDIPMETKNAAMRGFEDSDLPQRAFYKSQEHIKVYLKAPSTADFPRYDSGSVTRAFQDERGDIYEVVSHVDSQNSFGAKIRTNYKCTLVRLRANRQWVLGELKTW